MADKIPLAEQLDELRSEYTRRCQMYPEMVIRGQMRQEAAEFKIARMAAAYNTLSWLLKNADHVREWVIFTTKMGTDADKVETLADAPPDVLPSELTWEEPHGEDEPPADEGKEAAE